VDARGAFLFGVSTLGVLLVIAEPTVWENPSTGGSILAVVPKPETASVLSINQIVRSIGFSIGSALAGLLLAAATTQGALLPAEHGYVTAVLWVLPFLVISAVAILLVRRATVR
jgi:hypothetical protein